MPFSLAADTPQSVLVYFDGLTTGNVAAVAGATTVSSHATGTGIYVGLGTGGTAAACIFDNFKFDKYHQPSASVADGCNSITLGACAIGADTFTRADNTDITCAWNKESGTSAIVSNALALTSRIPSLAS